MSSCKTKLHGRSREYNKAPKTVKWKYFDPKPQITPEAFVTAHQSLLTAIP